MPNDKKALTVVDPVQPLAGTAVDPRELAAVVVEAFGANAPPPPRQSSFPRRALILDPYSGFAVVGHVENGMVEEVVQTRSQRLRFAMSTMGRGEALDYLRTALAFAEMIRRDLP